MKKIAITLSAATLLLGGLVGCNVDRDDTTGQGVGQRGFGYHATDQRDDTGITGQRAGEGPITDMFTRDDRRGARGFGRDTRRPATGLAGERTEMRGTRTDTGRFGTDTRNGSTGVGSAGTGIFGRNTDRKGTTGYGTGTRGAGAGVGTFNGTGNMRGQGAGNTTGRFGATNGRNGMTGHGIAASPGWQGETGYHGGTPGIGDNLGMRGTRGMARTGRGQAFGANDYRGGAGIVGNRPGYVDDRGILREDRTDTNGRARIGGLGQTGRRNMGQSGLGYGQQGANGRAGDRVVPGTGMSEFAYPDGYDATSVRDYTSRLADVENVRDSRVIVNGNRVLVGVDADRRNSQRIEQDIRQRFRGMNGDREIIVVTERDRYDQIRTADDRLRAGEPFEEVGESINEMFQDFGRAIQSPRMTR